MKRAKQYMALMMAAVLSASITVTGWAGSTEDTMISALIDVSADLDDGFDLDSEISAEDTSDEIYFDEIDLIEENPDINDIDDTDVNVDEAVSDDIVQITEETAQERAASDLAALEADALLAGDEWDELIVDEEEQSADLLLADVSEQFTGSGTASDPYQIGSIELLTVLKKEVDAGSTMSGIYFALTEDLTLPESWTPIGSSAETAFGGIIDGKDYTITVASGGQPLLGYVCGAAVSNLNIYGERIADYGLVSHFESLTQEGVGITLDHITLKSGSSTLKSGLLGSSLTSSMYAGSKAAYYAVIKNCVIESGVTIGYDKDQTYIGSIAGRMQGTVENCVSYADVYGVNYVGGLIGTKDNAMGDCTVTGSTFAGTVSASGSHAGGIAGGGYHHGSAPNGRRITINGCTVSGAVSGADKVGGILGGDSVVAQVWNAYSFRGNQFTGTVQASEGNYIGGIIGYYESLNCYDDIAGNEYQSGCGAERGIGFVRYVDTSCTSHETVSGTAYFSTENGTSECPKVTGCSWKSGLNRTDDPVGLDMDQLTSTDGTQHFLISLQLSGEYKTEYDLNETFDSAGMVFTAAYSDGTTEEVPLDQVTFSGFDSSQKGEQEITAVYEGAKICFTVTVLQKEASTITVSFSMYGDSAHDSSEDLQVHTLYDGNLQTWIEKEYYTVSANATVYDLIKAAAAKHGFTITSDDSTTYGSAYISAVDYQNIHLEEIYNGPRSGWMYTVNGVYPQVGVDQKYLQDQDQVIFHFTDDYTREGDQNGGMSGDESSNTAGTGTSGGSTGRSGSSDSTGSSTTGNGSQAAQSHTHVYGSWKEKTAATVFAAKVEERTCACGDTQQRSVGSKLTPTIKVNVSSIVLQVKHSTDKVKVSGLAAGDQVVSWKSANTKIAKVNQKGKITAGKKTGKTKITIKLASGKEKRITVTVQKNAVKTSKISGVTGKLTLKKGQSTLLTPVITPITSTQKITYT